MARRKRSQITPETLLPKWEAESRALFLGTILVKQLVTAAEHQELILAAFEAASWKSPIRAPLLPCKSKRTPQERLHDVVVRLNGRQKEARIFFFRTGRANEIGWELTPTHKKKPRLPE